MLQGLMESDSSSSTPVSNHPISSLVRSSSPPAKESFVHQPGPKIQGHVVVFGFSAHMSSTYNQPVVPQIKLRSLTQSIHWQERQHSGEQLCARQRLMSPLWLRWRGFLISQYRGLRQPLGYTLDIRIHCQRPSILWISTFWQLRLVRMSLC